ncbi:hypothetical protein [Microbacterium sp. BR1]|uniref:hypothetical protein n=1 Tax=Microbacterium sp. BR1 TaxID=1070896 RepID=UPI0012FD9D19|nr:hypothetical protein [Microbacterium sp. BR1]
MRSWLVLGVVVALAVVLLATLTAALPSAAPWVTIIGMPVVIVGAGLGAKFVQRRGAAERRESA